MIPLISLPQTFYWNSKYLIPVRDQGRCTSCWAFSVADMLSDRLILYTNSAFRTQLSVQKMLSCFKNHYGCDVGGSPEDVYQWISTHGLPSEKEYPYEQFQNLSISKCKKKEEMVVNKPSPLVYCYANSIDYLCNPSLTIGGKTHIQNIHNMMMDIYYNGPIVGTVEVYEDFYQYKPGTIYTISTRDIKQNKFYGGHSCEVIGWNGSGDIPYWIIRTNWGKNWPGRNQGGIVYVRLGTNEVNIESRASSAIPRSTYSFVNTIPSKYYTIKM